MEKLISMTDFVLEQYEKQDNPNKFESIVFDYANFLKQPLELWMFVPCKLIDDVWIVLEEPYFLDRESNVLSKWDEYKKAKDMVLFDGFEVVTKRFNKIDYEFIQNKDTYVFYFESKESKWIKVNDYTTIENIVLYTPNLTPTTLKQIGL